MVSIINKSPKRFTAKVEDLTYHTFNVWSDGKKWIITDNSNHKIHLPPDCNQFCGNSEEIISFFQSTVNIVDTFFLLMSDVSDALDVVSFTPGLNITIVRLN